ALVAVGAALTRRTLRASTLCLRWAVVVFLTGRVATFLVATALRVTAFALLVAWGDLALRVGLTALVDLLLLAVRVSLTALLLFAALDDAPVAAVADPIGPNTPTRASAKARTIDFKAIGRNNMTPLQQQDATQARSIEKSKKMSNIKCL